MASDGNSIRHLAAEAGLSRSYFTRVLRLSFLAPNIAKAIVLGRQPPELTANKLMQAGRLSHDWPEQRRSLGFN